MTNIKEHSIRHLIVTRFRYGVNTSLTSELYKQILTRY